MTKKIVLRNLGTAPLSFENKSRQKFHLVPPSRHSSDLVVEDPFNDDTSDHIVAREGENVELNCRVIGDPVPQITWLKLNYAGQYTEEILPNNGPKLVINLE